MMNGIKSLSMRKMEKNFIAHINKKYPRNPYLHYNLRFWLYRIQQEVNELEEAINIKDMDNVKDELADISNLVDYAFERAILVEDKKTNFSSSTVHRKKGVTQLYEHNKRLEDVKK